jgi:hypothetical protein
MGRSQMAALTLEEMVIGDKVESARTGTGSRAARPTGGARSSRWLLIGCGLLLAEALLAAMLRAQPAPAGAAPAAVKTSSATHTVQAGETLWSIAQRYLGNPRRWRDIAEANGLPMDAQKRLPVGKVLQLPGALRTADGSASADPGTPVAPLPTATAPQASAPPAMPSGEVSREDGRSGLFMRSPRRYEIGVRVDRDPDSLYTDGESVHATPKPRLGEALAAPFVVSAKELAGAPALGDRVAMTAPDASEFTALVRLRDQVLVKLPKGMSVSVGQRYLVVRDEAAFEKGRLVEPTGLVAIEQDGASLVARVLDVFGRIESGQRLLSATTDVPGFSAKAAPVAAGSAGASGTIRYIEGNPLLPTLQRYLVLSGGATAWRAGDEVELRTPKAAAPAKGWKARLLSMGTDESASPMRANELVGRARVVRVTPYGATAVIVHHEQPRIDPGTVATLVARIP